MRGHGIARNRGLYRIFGRHIRAPRQKYGLCCDKATSDTDLDCRGTTSDQARISAQVGAAIHLPIHLAADGFSDCDRAATTGRAAAFRDMRRNPRLELGKPREVLMLCGSKLK